MTVTSIFNEKLFEEAEKKFYFWQQNEYNEYVCFDMSTECESCPLYSEQILCYKNDPEFMKELSKRIPHEFI